MEFPLKQKKKKVKYIECQMLIKYFFFFLNFILFLNFT